MKSARLMASIAVLFIAGTMTGCMSPGFVRLANKPQGPALSQNGKKVALVIRDTRPEAIQKSNMCGVNHQTIFTIPVAPLFLAHREHLDQVFAADLKSRLETAGYQVIATLPAPQRSQDKKRYDPRKSASSADVSAAWDEKGTQKEEKKTIKEWKKAAKKNKNGIASASQIDERQVSPWGADFYTSGADIVIDVKIMKFWTEYTYWGSLSWMSAKYAVCSPDKEVRTVLHGNKLSGVAYWFSAFTPLTPTTDSTASANLAYWNVMKDFDNEIRRLDIDKLKAADRGIVQSR